MRPEAREKKRKRKTYNVLPRKSSRGSTKLLVKHALIERMWITYICRYTHAGDRRLDSPRRYEHQHRGRVNAVAARMRKGIRCRLRKRVNVAHRPDHRNECDSDIETAAGCDVRLRGACERFSASIPGTMLSGRGFLHHRLAEIVPGGIPELWFRCTRDLIRDHRVTVNNGIVNAPALSDNLELSPQKYNIRELN